MILLSLDLGRDPFWAHNLDPEELTAVRAALEVRRDAVNATKPAAEVMPADAHPIARFVHDARRAAKQGA
jgi:hypothetical protein